MPSTAVVAVAGRRLKRACGRWTGGLGADQLVATLGRHAVARVVGGTTSAVQALMVISQHTGGHIGKSQNGRRLERDVRSDMKDDDL
ncbi:hypothetical protein GW17_00018652 [Ensete ventricosum]|nr:hypothetical protein GW17_00018652 [Ensete ventricosum]